MQHLRQLDLTEEQAARVRAMTREFQSNSLELQWELEDRSQRFAELMGAEDIDVEAAAAQFDQVLVAEARIKRSHLRPLMDLRAVLTPQQRQLMSAIMTGRPGE